MQLKKRKLETANELDKTKVMGSGRGRVGEDEGDAVGVGGDQIVGNKRRRRLPEEEDVEAPSAPLPQKKRILPPGLVAQPSPSRKPSKDGHPEAEDDEVLIRETQAALKSLSGSWPHEQRNSLYTRPEHEESPAFENLFEDKKACIKMSPSSVSTSSSGSMDASSSLKDVITFRDQVDGKSKNSSKVDSKQLKQVRRVEKDNDAYKDKSDSPKPNEKYSSGYDPPDFNELVDDSSNDLEIDISEQSNDKDDDDRSEGRQRKKSEDKKDYNSNQRLSLYSAYKAATASHPFSSQSAFKPPSESGKHTRGPAALGPYPAEATFVGYPEGVLPIHHGIVLSESKPIIPSKAAIEDTVRSEGSGSVKEGFGKQYTVLQPAGAGSRATALQEAARGAPSVTAVAELRPPPPLSPASLSRGEILNKTLFSRFFVTKYKYTNHIVRIIFH